MLVSLPPQLFVYESELGVPAPIIKPVTNDSFGGVKPKNGLWTSTYDPECGSAWVQWNFSERFAGIRKNDLLYFHAYVLYPQEAKVAVIDTLEDLENLIEKYRFKTEVPFRFFGTESLDFEALSQDYDALHLTEKGQWATRHGSPNLYGWDVESTLWFRDCFSRSEYLGNFGFRSCDMDATEQAKRRLLGLLRRNPDQDFRILLREFQATFDPLVWEKLLNWVRRGVASLSDLHRAGIPHQLLAQSFWAISSTLTSPEETQSIDQKLATLDKLAHPNYPKPLNQREQRKQKLSAKRYTKQREKDLGRQLRWYETLPAASYYAPTFSWWAGSFVPELPRDYDPEIRSQLEDPETTSSRSSRNIIYPGHLEGRPTDLEIEEMETSATPKMYVWVNIRLDFYGKFRILFSGNDDTTLGKTFETMGELESFVKELPKTVEIGWLVSQGFGD